MATQKIIITVKSAKGLASKGTFYCQCSLLNSAGNKMNAALKTKSLMDENPSWNETLTFDNSPDFGGIQAEIWEKRRLRSDKLIGACTLKINSGSDREDIIEEWFPLLRTKKNESSGGTPKQLLLKVQLPESENRPARVAGVHSKKSTENVHASNSNSNTTSTAKTGSGSGKSIRKTSSNIHDPSPASAKKWSEAGTESKKAFVVVEPEDLKSQSTSSKSTSEKAEDSDDEMEDVDDDDAEQDDNDDDEDEVEEDFNNEDNWMQDEEEEEAPVKPKSLTTSGIFQAREAKINKVKDIIGVPPHIAQALLQFYKWDEEKFLMRFLENPSAVYKESKVEEYDPSKEKAKEKHDILCSVCFEDNQSEITSLSCGHYFCNDCWASHIDIGVKDGRSVDITCMQRGCKELIPDYIVRKVVTPELYQKYGIFVSKAFVESSSNVKWCPRAGCQNAVDVSQCIHEGKCVVAKCECGHKFCFLCQGDAHTPALCVSMKEWEKKCADDSETFNWIASNTKDCPAKGCGVPIEKNDGCFMMTCQKCRHQFCWLCCEPWSTHNDHFSCNRYKEGKLGNKPAWMDGRSNTDARQALDRYLFYYNRYINHHNSLKFEDKTREKAKRTMDALQTNGSNSYIDVQFIEAAMNQLLECRRVLKHTYVYAFYQQDPLKKDLFEFSQGDLEKITEKIAQLLESPVEKLMSLNTEVKSLTQVATRTLNNLLLDENL